MEMITEQPIIPAALHPLIDTRCGGSVLFHYAVVKEQQEGHEVTVAIEYRPVGDPAVELREISQELKRNWPIHDVLLVRRVGRLEVGAIISLIAVSSSSSEAAFAAVQDGICRLKGMRTIDKKELFG